MRAAIVFIILLAAVLRFWHIGRQSLWFDEAATVHIVSEPVDTMMTLIRTDERTPPLHYLILYPWTRFFGGSEISVRTPSALAGTAAVLVLYLLVRRLFGPAEGLVAALLLAISHYQIAYSQEARAYSLMLVLGLWSCELFVQLLEKSTPRREAAWVIVTALLLYSHLPGAFTILVQHVAYAVALWSPLPLRERVRVRGDFSDSTGETEQTGIGESHPSPGDPDDLSSGTPPSPSRGEGVRLPARRWLLLNVAVLALFSPWIPTAIAWTRSVGTYFWVQPMTLMEIVRSFHLYAGSWTLLAILVALAIVGMFRKCDNRGTPLLIGLAILPVAVPVLISMLTKPSFTDRYGLTAAAGLYALAAAGIVAIRWQTLRAAALVALCILSFTGRAFDWEKPDWRSVGQYLATHMRSTDVAAVNRKKNTYLYDYYVHRGDVRRIGFDGTSIPLSLPLPAEQHVWLILHSDVATADQILARAPWRIVSQQRYGPIEVFELEDSS